MPRGDSCWKVWAESLRIWMMTNGVPEVTKSIEEIKGETGTTETFSSLSSIGFWTACRDAKEHYDTIPRAGLEIEFTLNENNWIETITFRLNESWMCILRNKEERLAREG